MDTDWPLYVRGHDGVAKNLFIEVSHILVDAFRVHSLHTRRVVAVQGAPSAPSSGG